MRDTTSACPSSIDVLVTCLSKNGQFFIAKDNLNQYPCSGECITESGAIENLTTDMRKVLIDNQWKHITINRIYRVGYSESMLKSNIESNEWKNASIQDVDFNTAREKAEIIKMVKDNIGDDQIAIEGYDYPKSIYNVEIDQKRDKWTGGWKTKVSIQVYNCGSTSRFPMNASGGFNWKKIKETINANIEYHKQNIISKKKQEETEKANEILQNQNNKIVEEMRKKYNLPYYSFNAEPKRFKLDLILNAETADALISFCRQNNIKFYGDK